ncbi:MAG: LLM class F420-dependent oxidoreductase [Chloroflexota bacterium]
MRLGQIGLWDFRLRYAEPELIVRAAHEAEVMGYAALWIPDVGGDVLASVETLLGATQGIVVATGILNIWMHDPAEVAARRAAWPPAWRSRFLAGLGVSHAALIDRMEAGRYRRPLSTMRAYLDALDAATPPLPAGARVLAALGPRMLALAAERAAGAHPYNVTPEHTAMARAVLGPDRILAPEQAVTLATDPGVARELGRRHLSVYLGLENYLNNLRRLGFGDDDFAHGGSDRLVDALVPWGSAEQVARRVREHLDAGADHVCVQVVTPEPREPPLRVWQELAEALGLGRSGL